MAIPEDEVTRMGGLLPSPPASRPYDLADYVDGVGIYYGRVAPTHFFEHAHPEITVAVNLEGTSCLARWQTVTGRQLTRLIHEGHTAIIPSGQPHAGEWLREADLLQLYLSPDYLARAARDLVVGDRFEVAEDHTAKDPLIRQLGSALQAEFMRGGLSGRLYVDSLANVLVVHLLRQYSESEKPPVEPRGGLSRRELRRAVEYVDDNLSEDLTLAGIAGAVGLSPYHFARRFKESTDLSPHRYVIERRVERAKNLLLRGALSVAEIAREVGFSDQSHLNRHTKALLGVTPGQILQEGKNIQKDGKILQDP